ncbi:MULTISPECIES: site-2 protease family protein [Brevibacterium]|uniref:Peptidase M50 n=3 Tax=Brevibacterium casei TaxID=33889 RepID=K9AQM4_9MICO|nr:site-2 protease family protein [Brevibacterium casei]NJE68403.1 peptidase M50 [Brevibacterium sp. LS14]EKU49748.1 peptidase M50 [Brevibacterium casei S18]KZE11060.1 peptidase M50 [Brevibacterium casei]MCT1447107.1 site-2 protease family protein [Brevibacterium casei]MCT1550613.1 site-2 protease family protein [Brevibacterium casei]
MAVKNHQTGASSGLRLGTVLGAPVILAWSWFLAAIVITILFAPWVLTVRPDLGIWSWAVAFAYAVLLFASVFLHELAHGVAGQFYGQKVAAIELNIWGGFTRFEPQVDNPRDKAAMTSFVISIVGPIVNIVLALLGWWCLSAVTPSSVPWLLLIAVTFANVALGAINLLPGIPLDGGWALQALMWRITGSQYLGTIVASWVGRIIAAGFIGWSVITPLLAGQRPDPLNVAWMSLIAIMLWFSAGDAATHAKRARKMETYDLSQVIQPAIAATWDADLADTLDYANTLGNAKERTLIVVLDQKGLPYGLVDRHAAAGRLAESSARIPAGDVARPLAGWIGVPKDITAPHLLESLTHRPKAQFCLVMDGNTLIGVIDLQEFFDELLAA